MTPSSRKATPYAGQRWPGQSALLRALEIRWLLPWVALATLAFGFMKLASEVLEGATHALDLWVLQHLRTAPGQPIGPPGLHEAARDLTALGSPAVLVLVCAAVWLCLFVSQRRTMAWVALGASISGVVISLLLKGLFSRSRPEAMYHATVAAGYSFPSGHAMMSAVVFLTLALLMARETQRRSLRLCAVGIAAAASGLVGLTRIYLGVHWTSDVIAGWAAGAAWALACWLMAERLGLGQSSSP